MMLYRDFIKRLFDVFFSFIGLILFMPVFALVALLIKIDSRGSVFFTQERIGRKFKPFNIFKFRTMVTEVQKKGLPITVGNDPRITLVGGYLRKIKIDELPQLGNILKGEMSFVGPRPEVNKYVEMFYNDYKEILKTRPGITDLASIKYREESVVLGKANEPEEEYIERILPEKILLAKEYLKRSSLILDITIIFKTLIKIFINKTNRH